MLKLIVLDSQTFEQECEFGMSIRLANEGTSSKQFKRRKRPEESSVYMIRSIAEFFDGEVTSVCVFETHVWPTSAFASFFDAVIEMATGTTLDRYYRGFQCILQDSELAKGLCALAIEYHYSISIRAEKSGKFVVIDHDDNVFTSSPNRVVFPDS